MNDAVHPLPCAGSEHLDVLVDELDRLVVLTGNTVRTADAGTIAARRASEDAATITATLRLDGGLRTTTDAEGVARTERAGTWLDVLGGTVDALADPGTTDDDADGDGPGGAVDEATLARLAELEHTGAHAGLAADDLAPAFGASNADAGGLGTAIALLHARLTSGLVAGDRAGRLRRGPRVVHDASVGRVLFFPTEAQLLPDAWDALLRHLAGTAAGATRVPAAVRAGRLHLELLRHQPFDAANGRLARAAARLALLADDLLPRGLGGPDAVLAEDPLGYHEEVGASVRRHDATRWVERALEAQGIALRRTLDALGAPDATGPGEADDPALPAVLDATFTLGDVVAAVGGTSAAARERCSVWVVGGHAERIVGTGGLRLRRRDPRAQAALSTS